MDLTIILVFVLVFFISSFFLRRWRNLPPSRLTLPGLGTVPLMFKSYGKPVYQVFQEEAQCLGDVFSFMFCGQIVVVLNSVDSIQEAFVKNADACSDRPEFVRRLLNHQSGEHGILSNDHGESWRQVRRFTLQTLRDFGVGKTSLEEKILTEVDSLTTVLRKTVGKPISAPMLMQKMIGNIIFGIIFAKRYEFDDPDFNEALQMVNEFVKGSDFVPASTFLPKVFGTLVDKFHPQMSKRLNAMERMRQHVMEQIDDHEATFDINNIRDFIDLYWKAVKSGDDNDRKYITKGSVFRVITELFLAGASGNILVWVLLYMIEHPNEQMKCQDELHKVVGDRIVTYGDRSKLSYVNATLNEVQRMASLSALTAAHFTNADVTLGGYDVPPGTILIGNLYAIHKDPKYWTEPDTFRPERFIDDNGGLKKTEGLLPFSTGPRTCPGESLAKMEAFLVFTNLLQRFNLRREHDHIRHTMEAESDSFARMPIPYKMRFESRS